MPLALTPHLMHCTRSPRWQVKTWEIVPFMPLVSTVCNVQASFVQLEALVNGINDNKRMILQSVNPPSWNMNTEVDVGPWDICIYK